MLKLYNTLSHQVEEFTSLKPLQVAIYSCGPTVYDYQHIGHMRRYVGDDILVRVLMANGYAVHHVMNITDVGHLVSDSDTGEDKMEKGAKKFGKSVWDIAKMFEQQFTDSCQLLNIVLPQGKDLMHATDYIPQQIALIQVLEKKGYTYKISDGIYFDTSKFPDYFKLSRQNPDELQKGARVDFIEGKRNVSDFALWKFSTPDVSLSTSGVSIPRRQMEWESPWGIGFPGWHIECSAMSMKALGETLDIHTGGIDHIAIHHSNEIAQSEAATGKQFVRFWVHHNFLVVENGKMSKSLGNFITVEDVIKKGYSPMSLRYLYLQTHYRQEMNFTWEALSAAEVGLKKLQTFILARDKRSGPHAGFMKKFMDAVNDDMNMAKALAVVWEMLKSDLLPKEKAATLLEMDTILGLGISTQGKEQKIPVTIEKLVIEREAFRKAGDWGASDEMRKKIESLGFIVQDTKDGPIVKKK